LKKELRSTSNAVFSLKYHLIMVIKYRKKVFSDEIIVQRCKQIITETIIENDAEVINMECGIDHVHVLFSTKPSISLTKLINVIKGRSSRLLRKEFPELKKDLWGDAFWSPSYYLATTGNVSLNTLINYVENQREGM